MRAMCSSGTVGAQGRQLPGSTRTSKVHPDERALVANALPDGGTLSALRIQKEEKAVDTGVI